MPSNLKHKSGGGSRGDSSYNPRHVLLHPSQISHSHYTTSARRSMPSVSAELYRDNEDHASELDYQHPTPHSTASSRRASSGFSQSRSRSRPSTPPGGFGGVRNGSDHRSTHGIDLGGGPSWSSRPSSLGGLPEFSPERLGRGRLRRLDIGGFPSGRRKGMGIWRLLIRVLGGLGLAWIMFGLMRIVASQVRMIYSRWMHIPVELLEHCKEAEWTYHQPTLLTADPSMEATPINQLHSASIFFEIPADEPLYLHSQGSFSYGTVEFLPTTPQSTASQDAEWSENWGGGVNGIQNQKIRVEIDAKYRDPSVFSWARVCQIGGEGVNYGVQGAEVPTPSVSGESTKSPIPDQVGVVIWTPETSVITPKEHQLHLKIKVYVPPGLASRHGNKRAWLPSIVTDLPTFEHQIGYLAPTVEFHKFKARTQKSIQVKSLRAESIFLQTVNKSVHGTMEAWSSIHVETLNAGLDVNATLIPAPVHLHTRYTELFLKTSNAPLKSSVMLHADPRTPTKNVFKVTTTTSKGPLVVVFPLTPLSTHAVRSVDSPHLDPHVSDHDPANSRPMSELTSITSSKTAKNSTIVPEGSGPAGDQGPGSDSAVLISSEKNSLSTSPPSSFHSSSFSSPSRPILRFDGRTTHGPVYVDLPQTFEGHFALRTSNRRQPRVIAKGRDGSTEGPNGEELVREVTDKVLESGEVIRGTMRLIPAGPRRSKSSEKGSTDVDEPREEGQSSMHDVPSNKGKTEDGTMSIPPAWANVWTTNDRVELWV